jgi:hypothetical protein
MKRTPFLTVAAFALIVFASCKHSGISGLAIPKDAAIVVHISSSSLTSKLSWDEIKQTNWFKDASTEASDSLAKKLLENPAASGVDLKSDFAFFMKKQGNGGYMVFEGSLKSASDFEAMLKSMHHNAQVEKDGDLKYIKGGSNEMVSWTDSKFIAITDAPAMRSMNSFSMSNYEEKKFSVDSLKKFTKDLLNLSSSNSLTTDNRFSDLIKQDGDVHMWMNAEQYTSGLGGGMLSMMKLNTLFEGNVTTATLSFDNGKISMKSKAYYGKEMTKFLEKYGSKPVNAELINRIPSQNVVAVMALNYPPEGMKEFFKTAGLDGFANMFLGKFNYSFDELMSAYKGQMLVAVTDVTMTKEPHTMEGTNYTYNTTKHDMNVLVAASVNNKASFDKLIGIIQEQAKEEIALSKVSFKVTNDWFVAGNKPESVDKFLAGGNNNLPFASKISGHPFGMYIDIQKLMKSTGGTVSSAADSALMDASMKMWEDVVVTGGEYKNGCITIDAVVNLVDKSTNSLKQINRYADQMNAAKKLRPKYTEISTDSTMVSEPKVEAPPAQ